jgi:hypothetical protein
MRDLLEEARLADELGLTLFAVGEHHRPDYLVSSPATVLAAIAAQTRQIRLSSAVTVLSSDDPVRVFEQFAHVDLISDGRAEIMAGRGSFVESFPLFGYDLHDYDERFSGGRTSSARFARRSSDVAKDRASLEIAVSRAAGSGSTPGLDRRRRHAAMVVRAKAGLPMTLAIIGGQTAGFRPFVDLGRWYQRWEHG